MKIKIIITLLLMMIPFVILAQKRQLADAEKEELYRTEVREAIGLDYFIPDYSINKIDSEKMGTRLAKIVEFLCENYDHGVYSNTLNCIVEEQIKELNHPVIKKLKLKNVKKVDNEFTISFDAFLWPNDLNIKRLLKKLHTLNHIGHLPQALTLCSVLSPVNRLLSIVNYHLSTINYPHPAWLQ